MMLAGTEGWIDVHPRFHRGPSFTLWRGKELVETREFASGYEHDVEEVEAEQTARADIRRAAEQQVDLRSDERGRISH